MDWQKNTTKELVIKQAVEAFKNNPNDDALIGVSLALMWMDSVDMYKTYTPANNYYHIIQERIRKLQIEE